MRKKFNQENGDSNTNFVMIVLVLAVLYSLYPAPFEHGFKWMLDATFSSLEASTGNKVENRPLESPADGYKPKAPQVKQDKAPPVKPAKTKPNQAKTKKDKPAASKDQSATTEKKDK